MKRIGRYAPSLILVFSWYLTDAVGQTVTVPQASPEVIAYRLDQDVLWVVGQALGLAVPILLLFTGYAAKAAKRFQAFTRGRMWASWSVMAAAYLALTAMLTLLLRLIGRSLAASAGIANERFNALALVTAGAPEVLISAVGGLLLGAILYVVLNRNPRLWWVWGTAGALVASLAFLLAEPWTTMYRPITATDLPFTESIISTASRAHIPASAIGIRQGDGTACGAGGVIGLGPTRLLLLDENLITAHTEDQVLSTVGHEAKHFALDDNRTGFLILCLLIPVMLLAVHFIAHRMLRRWSAQFGFHELTHPAAFPLLALSLAVVMLAITPVSTQVHRQVEIEADRFGLEMIKQNAAYAEMLAREQSCYNLDPEEGWFRRLFRNNHPAVGERIRFANSYRPWITGQPLTYGAHFEPETTRPDQKWGQSRFNSSIEHFAENFIPPSASR